jgi:hypothetical protein
LGCDNLTQPRSNARIRFEPALAELDAGDRLLQLPMRAATSRWRRPPLVRWAIKTVTRAACTLALQTLAVNANIAY